MKFIYLFLFFVTLSTGSFGQVKKAYKKSDEIKLKDLTIKWQDYWNSHNMDLMGTLLQEDVDFVNVAGVWLKGKAATINDHKQKHLGIVFKNSIWTTDSVSIRYIKPDVAIIHLSWALSGDNDPDGTPRKPRHGIFTWVVTKTLDDWKILTAQNTNKREQVLPTNN